MTDIGGCCAAGEQCLKRRPLFGHRSHSGTHLSCRPWGAAKAVVVEVPQVVTDQGVRKVTGNKPTKQQLAIAEHGFDGLFVMTNECTRLIVGR
ncbi:hypothetical protein D3C76_1583600 [compost metagenome]